MPTFRAHQLTATTVAATVLLAGLLTGCGPGAEPESTPTGDATETSTSTPAPEPTGSETPTPPPGPTLSAADRENIRDAISSGNTAALEGYLSDPVTVILMSSECCWEISAADAVAQLMYVTDAPGPWDWAIPAATIAEWRTNEYYGDLFTGDDITGRAADGTIINFGIVGDRVTTILMGFEEGFTF